MNQLLSMVENGVTTNFFYDPNGNQIRKEKGIEKWYYTYDFENRLTKVEYFDGTQTIVLGQYFYDGDGKRIKKVENGETTVYIYSGIQVIYEKVVESGKETKYIGRVAKIEKVNGTETTTYFHMDHLGSTRGVTDATGNLITTLEYDPFGEVRSGSANGIKYTFTGKEQDATGLYYYGARFYDPKVGRFITKDLVAGDKKKPQALNPYSYVSNNPLRFIDPTGNKSTDDEDDDTDSSSKNNSELVTTTQEPKKSSPTPRQVGEVIGYKQAGVIFGGLKTQTPPNINKIELARALYPDDSSAQQEFIEGFDTGFEQGRQDCYKDQYKGELPLQKEVNTLLAECFKTYGKMTATGIFIEGMPVPSELESLKTAIEITSTYKELGEAQETAGQKSFYQPLIDAINSFIDWIKGLFG